jgi:hypothetical protein
MKKRHCLLTAASLVGGALALQGQISLVSFGFTDAPTELDSTNTTSVAETVAAGLGTATFQIVRNSASELVQSSIANVAGSGLGTPGSSDGAAQISGQNNSTYAWASDPATSNFFEFTVNFGGVSASEISFDSLVLTGRTGVEWNKTTGELSTYASNRRSTLTVRSSLDNFAANIGSESNPSFDNTTNDAWATNTIDLSSLSLVGTETDITFRIYTKSTGTAFHRTQLDSVELVGAVPEPSTYAALFGALALGFVLWRRSR